MVLVELHQDPAEVVLVGLVVSTVPPIYYLTAEERDPAAQARQTKMDTLREKMLLDQLWESGEAPWKVWA